MREDEMKGGTKNPLPRLGFLGVGWIGRHRMEAVAASGEAEISAIADANYETAEQALPAAPGAEICRSLEELLELDLDGIVIATPNAFHAEQAEAALRSGKSVFCQKPLGRTLRETERVVRAAREEDRLLGVDFSYRYTVGLQKIRELILKGSLGDVYAVDFVFHNAYGPDKAWFYDAALSGGGCMLDLGVHLIDMALWLLDFPEVQEVSSRLFVRGEPIPRLSGSVEDFALASLGFAGNTVARIACSWNLSAGRDAVIEANVYGTRGGASFRNVDGSFYDFVAERYSGTSSEILAGPPDPWGGRAAVDWARRLRAGERFDPEAERLLDVAAALDAIYGRGTVCRRTGEGDEEPAAAA
jgi:predicted dehydrogenase